MHEKGISVHEKKKNTVFFYILQAARFSCRIERRFGAWEKGNR